VVRGHLIGPNLIQNYHGVGGIYQKKAINVIAVEPITKGSKMLRDLLKEILKEEITGVNKMPPEESRTTNLNDKFVGLKVMVRTYSAGVHFGTLVEKVGQEAILKDSRRVYSWQKAATLSQLAMEGSKSIESCKITMAVNEILLNRVIEIIPMTETAVTNLYGAIEWKI